MSLISARAFLTTILRYLKARFTRNSAWSKCRTIRKILRFTNAKGSTIRTALPSWISTLQSPWSNVISQMSRLRFRNSFEKTLRRHWKNWIKRTTYRSVIVTLRIARESGKSPRTTQKSIWLWIWLRQSIDLNLSTSWWLRTWSATRRSLVQIMRSIWMRWLTFSPIMTPSRVGGLLMKLRNSSRILSKVTLTPIKISMA